MRRTVLSVLALIALGVVVAVGLSQAGGGSSESAANAPAFDLKAAQRRLAGGPAGTAPPFDRKAARGRLAGAPAPLASLHRDASRLLGGGQAAFDARVRS